MQKRRINKIKPGVIAFIIVFLWDIWAIFKKKLALTVHPLNGMIYLAYYEAFCVGCWNNSIK